MQPLVVLKFKLNGHTKLRFKDETILIYMYSKFEPQCLTFLVSLISMAYSLFPSYYIPFNRTSEAGKVPITFCSEFQCNLMSNCREGHLSILLFLVIMGPDFPPFFHLTCGSRLNYCKCWY